MQISGFKKNIGVVKGAKARRSGSLENSDTHVEGRFRFNSLPDVLSSSEGSREKKKVFRISRSLNETSYQVCVRRQTFGTLAAPSICLDLVDEVESISSDDEPTVESYDGGMDDLDFAFDNDRIKYSFSQTYQHENIYRGLLRCLLHPLGAPDTALGLRPGDLVDHLREVFDVDREDHELFIREELQNKPQAVQVNIGVIEANGLKHGVDSGDIYDPYCLVCIVHPSRGCNSRGSPRSSPRGSPKGSPSSSPQLSHVPRSPSTEQLVLRTHTVKKSSQPKWNEEFQLDIEDSLIDEIHVYLCDQEQNQSSQDNRLSERPHGLKNLFGLLRHTEHDKLSNFGCLGRIVIPVREISTCGSDRWYDVVALGSTFTKPKVIGKCRLTLSISCKQGEFDQASFSIEDYYQAFQQFTNYSHRKHKIGSQADDPEEVQLGPGVLSRQDLRILHMFAVVHRISKLSEAIVNVICLLELACQDDSTTLGEVTLPKALDDLQMTWASMQLDQKNVMEKMPLTDTEIAHYRKAAARYINSRCSDVEELPTLFPPSVENLNVLKSKLGVTVQLLELDLWDTNSTPQKDMNNKVSKKLQQDVTGWMEVEFQSIYVHELVKDAVLPELTKLVDIVKDATSHCSILGVVRQFYHFLGINYYRVVSFALEKRISLKAKELMMEMNKYQKRYHNFPINITASSRLSLRLYFSLRKFHAIVRDNISRRDVFRLSLSHYQEWFEESLIFWLQTFRSECFTRLEKALEIDKDVVVVTKLLKYSNSSVDVLSCFAKVTDEWRHIDIRDPDCALMGVTKITDILCDGTRLYADKIHGILERNCYYDSENAEFDVTERLCITLNNIEHVRQYLSELPHLLDWDSVTMLVSTRYENDDVGEQAQSTLRRLIQTTNGEIRMKCSILLQQIAEKMRVEIDRCIEIFTRKAPEKLSSVDQLIAYLSTNLKTLNEQLMPALFPLMIEQLWLTVLVVFDDQLKVGEQAEYYRLMIQHLRSVTAYFVRGGMEDNKIQTMLYDALRTRLDLNCMKTEELMLDYFDTLADNMGTPTEYYGHLALKTAYVEETRGNVTIFVKVVRGVDLPGLDPSGLSDPYVVVTLHPQTMFGHLKPQKTRIVDKTLNPVFNTTFQFPNVPKHYLSTKGAVILLSVLDHDKIGLDDFAGEIVLHLYSVPQIGIDDGLDNKPVVMMPIKRPVNPHHGPFQVLCERESWDKNAKVFCIQRRRYIEKQPERTDTASKVNSFFSVFANILH